MNTLLNKKHKSILHLLPALLILYGFVGFGLFFSLKQALSTQEILIQENSLEPFIKGFFISLRLALLSTFFSLILSLFILYILFLFLEKTGYEKAKWWLKIFEFPLFLPYVVAGQLIFLTYSQSGLWSRVGYHMGIVENISDFPILVNDSHGLGIFIAFVWKTTPFFLLMLLPTLLALGKNYKNMSRVFGMGHHSYFWRVLVPYTRPILIFCSFIIFCYTFSSYEVPSLLGITYPKSLSVIIYNLYTKGTTAQQSVALLLSFVITVFFFLSGFGIFFFTQKSQKHFQRSPLL